MSIIERFALLDPPRGSRSNRYTVVVLAPGLRLGKGSEGEAVLLAVDQGIVRPSIETKYLRAEFGVLCEVAEGDHLASESCTIIQCLSTDVVVRRHFLECVSAALSSDQIGADAGTVVATLIEIFRAISRDAVRTVQGLWGEVLAIWQADDPALLTAAWHENSRDIHDFAAVDERVEIKTTTSQARRHHFSHSQLARDRDHTLLIGSVLLEPAANGVTLRWLVEKCVDRLPVGRDRSEFLRKVADTLGNDWLLADRQRYSLRHALSSLRFFRADALPALECTVDPRISDISYSINLGDVTALSETQLAEWGELGQAIVQRRRISEAL